MNNLNPTFTKPIDIDYHFEKVQKLMFSVFDIDNETSRLDDDDFLGQMDCNLGQVGTCDVLGFRVEVVVPEFARVPLSWSVLCRSNVQDLL